MRIQLLHNRINFCTPGWQLAEHIHKHSWGQERAVEVSRPRQSLPCEKDLKKEKKKHTKMIFNFSDFFRELWSKGVKLSLYYIALQLSIWTQIVICYYKDIQAQWRHTTSLFIVIWDFLLYLLVTNLDVCMLEHVRSSLPNCNGQTKVSFSAQCWQLLLMFSAVSHVQQQILS